MQSLIEQDIVVQIIDVGPIIYPKMAAAYNPRDALQDEGHLARADSLEDLRLRIQSCSDRCAVISYLGFGTETIEIHRTVKTSGRLLLYEQVNALPPDEPSPVESGSLLARLRKYFFQDISSLPQRVWRSIRFRMRRDRDSGAQLVQPAPDLLIAGGLLSVSHLQFDSDRFRTIWAHAMDYDQYLATPKTDRGEPLIVMLDENFAFHPEFLIHKNRPADPETYYGTLNRLFDHLEESTGWKVVIAAHPRSDPDQISAFLAGRPLVIDKTIELVQKSRLVVGHASTAFNYAVLCRKPTLFVTMDQIEHVTGKRG
ncbi:MAG: hypothetical protein KDK37_17610, partial [Leptospiraceae bacterium]|nr:hypothetical protein [Leptospiraceae bacterium]